MQLQVKWVFIEMSSRFDYRRFSKSEVYRRLFVNLLLPVTQFHLFKTFMQWIFY